MPARLTHMGVAYFRTSAEWLVIKGFSGRERVRLTWENPGRSRYPPLFDGVLTG